MKPYQCYKLVKTGGICEIFVADTPFTQQQGYSDTEPKELPWEFRVILEAMQDKPPRGEEYRARSAFRARNAIRRLVQTNFDNQAKFLTLTFRNTQEFNINDPRTCHDRFVNFIRRLVYQYGDFRYIAVPEFQKRGAIHYHMVCDLPYIPSDTLEAVWSHGFVKINAVRKSSRVGIYIAKYLTKESYSDELMKIRKFFTSKNLKRPTVIYGKKVVDLLTKLKSKYEPQFVSRYDSLYNGEIKYFEFVLYREEVIPNEVLSERNRRRHLSLYG